MKDSKDVYFLIKNFENDSIITNSQFTTAFKRAAERLAECLGLSRQLLFNRPFNLVPPRRIEFRNIFFNYQRVVEEAIHILAPGGGVRDIFRASAIALFGNFLENIVFFNF